MTGINKRAKLYSKKTIFVVFILLLCLLIIYRFNLSTKSENQDVPMKSINFIIDELGKEVNQDVELHQDESGNYYIIMPEKVDKFYVDKYSITKNETVFETQEIIPFQNSKNEISEEIINTVVENTIESSQVVNNNLKVEQGEKKKHLTSIDSNSIVNVIDNSVLNDDKTTNSITQNMANITNANDITNNTVNNIVNINSNVTVNENVSGFKNIVETDLDKSNVLNQTISNALDNDTIDNDDIIEDVNLEEKYSAGDKFYINEKDIEKTTIKFNVSLKNIEVYNIKLYSQELETEDSGNLIKISGYIPLDYNIEATKQENEIVTNLTSDVEELKNNEVLMVYDIKIKNQDSEFQPKDYQQSVNVSIVPNAQYHEKIDNGQVEVLHILETKESITFEKIETKLATDTLNVDIAEFVTDSFSSYAVTVLPQYSSTADAFILNEYDDDYNFYIGQSQTFGKEYGINYTEDKIAKININYYGTNKENTLKGYISDTERQYIMSYTKAVPLDERNNFKLEMIDNPFMDRPAGYGFDGWITTTSGMKITTDSNTFAQTISGNCSSSDKVVNIDVYVNWKKANVIFLSEKGKDINSGTTIDKPVQSIKTAKNLLNKNYINATNASKRELNILVIIEGNYKIGTGRWSPNHYDDVWCDSKAYTLTSLYNGKSYVNKASINIRREMNLKLKSDFQMHHITFYSDSEYKKSEGTGTLDNRIEASSYNFRIGRGIKFYKNGGKERTTFGQIIGGGNANKTYKMVIESGRYNNIQGWSPSPSSNNTMFTSICVFGSDIDKANNDNNKLKNYYRISSRTSSTTLKGQTNKILYNGDNLPTSKNLLYVMIVKSGSFGKDYFDRTNYDDRAYSGFYVGGHGSSGDDLGNRCIIVEGGSIANIIGGLQTKSKTNTETYIYMKNGTAENIVGGAGITETHGDRFIQITGGTVKYSVSGGSNGVYAASSGSNNGKLTGNSKIYIGGNAIIGDATKVETQSLYGVRAGCVLGAGNGNGNSPGSGSIITAKIIIDGNAIIRQDVYGGGNYGPVIGISEGPNDKGINSSVDIFGGEIYGNVYGGPNKNDVNGNAIINMYDGNVDGVVYGGSNEDGDVSQTATINIYGGTIDGDDSGDAVFGGGQGKDTIVRNSKVNITDKNSDIIINGNIYGGSAFGTIGGQRNTGNTEVNLSDSQSDYDIIFNVSGQMLFGGGKGERNTRNPAKTTSNVTVNVDGGTYSNLKVFGGYNAGGLIYGNVTVNVGKNYKTYVNEVYGSGNNAQLTDDTDSDHVYIYEKATVTNAFNGGNKAGISGGKTEPPRSINIIGATVTNVYGACNLEGNFKESHVNISNGATIGNVYGGGFGTNAKVNMDTNISITGNATNITGNVYGGGYSGGVGRNTYVLITKGAKVSGNVYGGSYEGLIENETNIEINEATVKKNVFGGGENGQVGEKNLVGKTNINILNSSEILGNVYGGGLGTKAEVDGSTNVIISSAKNIVNVYGGGEEGPVAGNTTVKISNISIADSVYGGGNKADVFGNTNVILDKVNTETVYGGGNNGIVGTTNTNIANVLIQNNSNITNAFGGGNKGDVFATANITIDNSTISKVLYGGGNEADVSNTKVFVKNGVKILGTIFGGGNLGNITNDTNVNVQNSTVGVEGSIEELNGNIFAGGNGTTSETSDEGVVNGSTNVSVKDMTIYGSLFGGGNGKSATVKNDSHVITLGNTVIKESIYGGGNNSQIGSDSKVPSDSIIEISGGNIGGDIFGGSNYDVVYGNTSIFIGNGAINKYYMERVYPINEIDIVGNVYGGGNSPGKDVVGYDPSFKSVTGNINIYVDGAGYEDTVFNINQSIFASGNISNATTNGNIHIENFGTEANKKSLVSIQRATDVTIDNSVVRIIGEKDSTAFYANIPYSFNLVENLKIKNNTTLYLLSMVYRLSNFSSLVDVDGTEVKAEVKVKADGSGIESKNVDNRIYMRSGSNFNVSPSMNLSEYGNVTGMTFFGIFREMTDGSGNIIQSAGMYDRNYETSGKIGSNLTWDERDYDRTYATGLKVADYNIDGFYTVFEELTNDLEESEELTEENYAGFSKMSIIIPEDLDSYYMWFAGPNEDTYYYQLGLTASKFSTLGTEELPLQGFMFPNSRIDITSFTTALEKGATLVDKSTIPSINEDENLANTQLGLGMKTGNVGWNMVGSTDFYSEDGGSFSGTNEYTIENSTVLPSLQFYLYHSNNITEDLSLGSVSIRMKAYYWIDELNQGTATIVIDINLSTMYLENIGYNGAITPGVEYDLFTNTAANITTKSSFSAYFELAEPNFFDDEKVQEHFDTAYRYIEVPDDKYVFPENTTITMIDRSDKNNPSYYYYIVSKDDEDNEKRKFRLDEFTVMGSTDAKFDEKNIKDTYKQTINGVEYEYECFIFIVNFANADFSAYPKGSEITSDNLLTIGLQDDYVDIDGLDQIETLATLLGGQSVDMKFGIYDAASTIGIDAGLTKSKIYLGDETYLNIDTKYDVKLTGTSGLIYDTQYFDKKLGVKISLYHENDRGALELVPGSALLGTYFELNGEKYFPRADGTTRIKIAELVSNANSHIDFNTDNASINTDDYIMRIESYGSPDGIYFGLVPSDTKEINLQIVNNSYGLDSTLPAEQTIIDKETGHTLDSEGIISENTDANKLDFSLKYQSGLGDPYIAVSLYRRNYNVDDIYENNYTLVNLQDYVEETLEIPNEIKMATPTAEQVSYMNTLKQFNDTTYVYKAIDTSTIKTKVGGNTMTDVLFDLTYHLKENLTTGTYKVVFTLYDAYDYKVQRPILDSSGSLHYEQYDMIRYANVGDTFSYIIIKGKNE